MNDETHAQDAIGELRALVDNLSYANGAAFCAALDLQITRLRASVRMTDEMEETLRRLRMAGDELTADVEQAGPAPSELIVKATSPMRDKCKRHLDLLARQAGKAAPNPMAALLELSAGQAIKESGA